MKNMISTMASDMIKQTPTTGMGQPVAQAVQPVAPKNPASRIAQSVRQNYGQMHSDPRGIGAGGIVRNAAASLMQRRQLPQNPAPITNQGGTAAKVGDAMIKPSHSRRGRF